VFGACPHGRDAQAGDRDADDGAGEDPHGATARHRLR
jgi:hypothetical protein